MTREEVADKLRTILTSPEHMGVNIQPSEIIETSSLLKDFKLDSIQTLEFVVAIENTFGFPIASRELKPEVLNQFGVLVTFVHRHVSSSAANEN